MINEKAQQSISFSPATQSCLAYSIKGTDKGKPIPIQVWREHEGFRKLRLPDLMIIDL